MRRDQIAALVPGGVPDPVERAKMVVDLLELDAEIPETDPEAMSEVVVKAARALLADLLLIDKLESEESTDHVQVERVARALCFTESGGSPDAWERHITLYRERARKVLTEADAWRLDAVVAYP